MPARKDLSAKVLLQDGTAVEIRALDGLVIDDLLIQGMKAEGYRVITGRDVFPVVDRTLKDYLIRIGLVEG